MYNKSIILMTALLPTVGHKALIDFARYISREVHVIISTRSHEPITGYARIMAFERTFNDFNNVYIHHHPDDRAPQNPSDYHNFWNWWKNVVVNFVGPVTDKDVVVASEHYGIPMSETLGCNFMPFDINRETYPVKSTEVRKNIIRDWDKILPVLRPQFATVVTLFGPESVGKTTMTKALADYYGCRYIPEWARSYLELVGPEVTMEIMETISLGQYSLQDSTYDYNDKPYIFQDTDLLSTIGYYKLWNKSIPKGSLIEFWFESTKSDLYIVMNDQIPFTADILRYGGNKRESSNQFWIDLLKFYNCDYYIVKETEHEKQLTEIMNAVNLFTENKFAKLANFERE